MITKGYVYESRYANERCTVVYKSIQELRLNCGEIPEKEIVEVDIVKICHDKTTRRVR